jgi:hypothetical protein
MMDVLRRERLDSAVWRVLGGNPAHYLKLDGKTDRQPCPMLLRNLGSDLTDALGFVLKSSTNTKSIVKIFREEKLSENREN